jgi:hypothetical protein
LILIPAETEAKTSAQKIDRVWNREKALIEVVKYGSEIFTEPDVNSNLLKAGTGIYTPPHWITFSPP